MLALLGRLADRVQFRYDGGLFFSMLNSGANAAGLLGRGRACPFRDDDCPWRRRKWRLHRVRVTAGF
jgi:hypothetical protein